MMKLNIKSKHWMRQYHAAPPGASCLICLPHAGGAANYFHPLSAALSPDIAVFAIQYPGRQDRMREPLITSLSNYVLEIASVIEVEPGFSLSLMGHSMGAVLAFELAFELKSRGISVDTLFLSSHAPGHHPDKEMLHRYDDEHLIQALLKFGEQNSELLRDPDFSSLLLPIMRADMAAIETHQLSLDKKLEGTTIFALGGDRDIRATADDMRQWQERTSGAFYQHEFQGGHFYMQENIPQISRLIKNGIHVKQTSII